jgi:hypothetical protein
MIVGCRTPMTGHSAADSVSALRDRAFPSFQFFEERIRRLVASTFLIFGHTLMLPTKVGEAFFHAIHATVSKSFHLNCDPEVGKLLAPSDEELRSPGRRGLNVSDDFK